MLFFIFMFMIRWQGVGEAFTVQSHVLFNCLASKLLSHPSLDPEAR